jgi:hypothetical protein
MLTGEYILKSGALPLNESLYGKDQWARQDYEHSHLVKVQEGDYAMRSDSVEMVDSNLNIYYRVARPSTISEISNTARVFIGFLEYEGDFNNIKTCRIKQTDVNNNFHVRGTYLVHKKNLDIHDKLFKEWKDTNNNKSKRAKMICDRGFSDSGPDENTATTVNVDYVRERGGGIFEDFRKGAVPSKELNRVGNIPYSFGIELETEYGYMPSDELREIQFATFSDGSIRADEYVSPPLHGNLGLTLAQGAVKKIAQYCYVNDKNSMHVHVGGLRIAGCKYPSFNLNFAINSIMLGLQIEEEMFMMQPASRNPRRKYCASICKNLGIDTLDRDYHDQRTDRNYTKNYWFITPENGEEVVADYVFGNNDRPNSFANYVRQPLGRWTTGRYKWLNLVNFCSRSRFKTIEYRTFAGTTNWEKVYNNILLSLAITKFIDEQQTRIREAHEESSLKEKGIISLKEIVDYSFNGKYNDLAIQLNNFIDNRKEKFKRKSVYPN